MNEFEELRSILKKSKELIRNKEYDNAWKELNIKPHLANAFNSDSSILMQIEFTKQRSRILKKENRFEDLLFQELKIYLLLILNEIAKYPFGSQYVWFKSNHNNENSYLFQNKNIKAAISSLSLLEKRDSIFNIVNTFAFTELPTIYGIEAIILETEPTDMDPLEFLELNKKIEQIKGKQIDVEIYKISELIKSALRNQQ